MDTFGPFMESFRETAGQRCPKIFVSRDCVGTSFSNSQERHQVCPYLDAISFIINIQFDIFLS